MLTRTFFGHQAHRVTPRPHKTPSFAAILALFFASAVPGQSQIFKANPVLYQSGGDLARGIAVADVNKDGNLDVIVANGATGKPNESTVGVLLGNGDGTLQTAVTYAVNRAGADAVAVADLNGDGWPDLVVGVNAGGGDPSLFVLLNRGDGTFEAAAGYPANYDIFSVAIADVNGDGKPDVIALAQAGQDFSHSAIAVLLGSGDGTLEAAVTYDLAGGSIASSLAVADLNGDGKPDLVATDDDTKGNGALFVLLNKGNGTFPSQVTYPTQGWGQSVILGDVNGDGKLDAVVVSDSALVNVLFGNGNGTFGKAVVYPTGLTDPLSVAMGDFNGDGTRCPLGGGVAVLLGVPATTTTKVTTSGTPSQNGHPVTFTAGITATEGPIPNGTAVTFYNNGTKIGTATTMNGTAKFTTSSLIVGTHTIKASCPSSAYFKASSGSVIQVVN